MKEKKDMGNFSFQGRDFKPYYEEHIYPQIEEFEQKRITTLKNTKYKSLLFFLVYGIGILFFLYGGFNLSSISASVSPEFLVFGVAVSAFVFLSWILYPIYDHGQQIKTKIFPHVFRFFGESYHYSLKSPITVRSLEQSKIIPDYHDERTEDYVKGVYGDTTFEMFDAVLERTVGTGKNKRIEYPFEGVFILMCMNKNFKGQTIVLNDAGFIGNFLQKRFDGLRNVKLEDPAFEKKFEVYSTDQVEARYLLTTSFMERLLQLVKLLKAPRLQCSFYNNKILLMIPSKVKRFETSSIFSPSTFETEIGIIFEEMRLIFEIIETLKLNQRTGL